MTIIENTPGVDIRPPDDGLRHKAGNDSDIKPKNTSTPGDGVDEISSGSSSPNSSGSRLSIRIPRKVLSGEESGSENEGKCEKNNGSSGNIKDSNGNNESEREDSEEAKGLSPGGSRKASGSEDDEQFKKKKKSSTKKPNIIGRKRRGKNESDEDSAFSESDLSDEESESEDVYSEEEGMSESGESSEDDGSAEEWDARGRKFVKKSSPARKGGARMVPMIPFQYSKMGYTPIQPLPPNMANIPMFAKMTHAPLPPSSSAAAAGATNADSTAACISPPVVDANTAAQQVQETVKNTIASLASAPSHGKILLPRNPEAPVRPSPELKETLTSMLAHPEWRNALLAKLQQNRQISAEQASKLGLQPASAPVMPPMQQIPIARSSMTAPPYMMMPPHMMGMVRPPIMSTSSSMRGESVKGQSRKIRTHDKEKSSKRTSPTYSIEDVPIAARREKRTPRKAVDYSKFFQEEESETEESSLDDEETTLVDRERKSTSSKEHHVIMAPKTKRPKKSPVATESEKEYGGSEEDKYVEEEEGMGDSRSSDDVPIYIHINGFLFIYLL